jgi:Holliday junction resolvase RusA-like endonuclease
MRYRVELPVPPPLNRMWRKWQGRMVLSEEARAYKRAVGLRCKVAGMKPLSGAIEVRIAVYRARKSGDLDGRLKVLL